MIEPGRRVRHSGKRVLADIPLLLVLLSACNEELPTKFIAQTPLILGIDAPATIFQAPASRELIRVQARDPQGLNDLDAVSLSFKDPSTGNPLSQQDLQDDGQNGDILAGDGVYYLVFSAALTQNGTGAFLLEARARDKSGTLSDVVRDTLTVLAGAENRLPQLLAAVSPDTVWLDSTYTFQLRAEAGDDDGIATLRPVVIQVFPPAYPTPAVTDSLVDDGLHGDGIANDGTFAQSFSPALFTKGRGLYEVVYHARDGAGGYSNSLLRRVTAFRRIVNQPPRLSGLQAPATISRNATPNTYLLSVFASDPNGRSDLKRVFFNSFLPSGDPSTGNPWAMGDNGQQGDALAGDGRYSLTVVINATAALGDYRFEFQAEDLQGALSAMLIHTITVTN